MIKHQHLTRNTPPKQKQFYQQDMKWTNPRQAWKSLPCGLTHESKSVVSSIKGSSKKGLNNDPYLKPPFETCNFLKPDWNIIKNVICLQNVILLCPKTHFLYFSFGDKRKFWRRLMHMTVSESYIFTETNNFIKEIFQKLIAVHIQEELCKWCCERNKISQCVEQDSPFS